MATHPNFPPEFSALRDALRELRQVVRRGRDVVEEQVPQTMLPRPAVHLVGKVIREVDHLAEGAEGLARRLLAGPPRPMGRTGRAAPGGAGYPSALYAALGAALTHLGARYALVSESALAQILRDHPLPVSPAAAAVLARRLLAGDTIRDIRTDTATAPQDLAALAVFALFLWLLAEDRDNGEPEALEAAADIARVLEAEVRAAFADPGPERLAGLIQEFRGHV